MLSKGSVAIVLRLAGAGFAFLLQVSVARYLAVSRAGIYFLAVSIITLVAMVARLGMDNSVVRFVAAYASERDWAKVRGVWLHAIRISLGTSLIFSGMLCVASGWLASDIFRKPDLSTPLRLMSYAIAPLSVLTIYGAALQGLKRVRDALLTQGVLMPLFSVLALFVLAPRYGLAGAAEAYGIGVFLTLLCSIWMWGRASTPWRSAIPSFPVNVLLKGSGPLLGVVLLQQVVQALPLLLLGVWSGSADVGLFGVAQRTTGQISLVLVAVNVVVAPKIAELYQRGNMIALGRLARQGSLLMTVMASPALLLFLLAPRWIMNLFGSGFEAGWPLLVIMALGQLVNVATGSVGFLLVMTGNEKAAFSAGMIAAIGCFVLCMVLIPSQGARGAATASAVTIALVNLLRARFVWRLLGINVLPALQLGKP